MKHLPVRSAALLLLASGSLSAQWNQAFPATNPPARLRHSLVEFPGGTAGDMLLFGGKTCSSCTPTYFTDQWRWDGTDWKSLTTTTSRGVVDSGATCFLNGKVVSFSGWDGSTYPLETWTFDGIDWTLESPSATPPGRDWSALAAYPTQNLAVLFGGHDWQVGGFDDTWTWNGTDWTLQTPASSPHKLSYHAMAYDGNTDAVLLFGGSGPTGVTNDMWSWNGATWTKLSPATLPSARAEATMAWDPIRNVVVLTGGWDNSQLLSDTWEWNGTGWTQVVGAGGNDRAATPMVYDTATNVMRYFGGALDYSYSLVHDQTWEFSGPNPWTDLGLGLAGALGEPVLSGQGYPSPGGTVTFSVSNVQPNAAAFLVAGVANLSIPLFGGTLVPSPNVILSMPIDANGDGQKVASFAPTSTPGVDLFLQVWVIDATGPQGWAASNGLHGQTQ